MTQSPRMPETQTSETGVADAPGGNWVDRFAPAVTRPYLRLSRADRPIGTWLLLIPCLWGLALAAGQSAPRLWDLWIVAGCAAGSFLMRGAGCTWNDITDRKIDAQVERTRSRPLPSGQVSVRGALIWMVAQMAIAALILFSYNWTAVALGIAALLPVAVYPFAKRFTWWPQVFLGIAFNWGALFAWVAHQGTLGWPAVWLYAAGIVWTLFYDTIYAHQDREDDALIGVKSTARLFGTNSVMWLRGFLVGAVLLAGLAVITALIDAGVLAMVLGLAGVWAFGWHLAWQLRNLNIDDAGVCLRLFRSNRDAGI
ncbi:MAG: 4-hydroxybenzoate octaprenyltransferase, partial [Paracoccaceae bacterium]